MPLVELLGEFGLEPKVIARDRDMAAGFAAGHERAAKEQERHSDAWATQMLCAATEYRRAAAHSVLLSDADAWRELFDRAGRAYESLRRPYALMMFWCARDGKTVYGRGRDFGGGEKIERTQLPYVLLTSAAEGDRNEDERRAVLRERVAGAQNTRVGILGLPVGAYVDLANALDRFEPVAITAAVLPFLVSYSDAVRRCNEDRYHWPMLAFPFHPAEPDVLSVLFLTETVLRARTDTNISLRSVLETTPLFPAATDLLYNALLEHFGYEH